MCVVQRLVDLIEQVEGGGVTSLDCKDQRQRDEGLLPSAQLIHLETLPACEKKKKKKEKGWDDGA
jgi:hypothetical protein